MPDEQLAIDFGDETLNDPQYEQKVQDDGTLADAAPDGAQEQGQQDGAAPQQQADGQPVSEEAGAGGNGQQPAPQPGQQQQQPDTARPKADKDGNLVDAQGNVIAKAGPERRSFERVQAQDRVIKDQATQLQKRDQEIAQLKAMNDAPQKLGLDMQETQMGLQAIASFKKDPVATARWMLQETMRLGYNLQQIIGGDANGQLNGGSLDLAAVKSMIGEAVQPLVQDRQAQQVDAQAQQNAQREYDKFMANHDHASVHESAIAALVQQDKSRTPEVAYWQLREYAAKHNLDFSKPLGPQVQARQQGGQQQQTPAPNGNATPQAQTQQPQPMPNGGAPTQDMQQGPTMADPDDAWDTIVNQSLRDAGMMQ